MWEILPSEQKSEYKRMILAFASLTEVFSQKAENNENKESYAPIINSKFQETVFQKAFNASAEDIGNTSYDAAISLKLSENEEIKYLIGIKTFGINSGDQKIAQFKANHQEWAEIINRIENNSKKISEKDQIDVLNHDLYKTLAIEIAKLRNMRIASSESNLKGFSVKSNDTNVQAVYHVLMPSEKGAEPHIYVGETSYDKINIDKIQILGCTGVKTPTNFKFTDGNHEYKFTPADSQLYMTFHNREIVRENWKVKFLENPYEIFSEIADKIEGKQNNTELDFSDSEKKDESPQIVKSFSWLLENNDGEVELYSGFNNFYGVSSKLAKKDRPKIIEKIKKDFNSTENSLINEIISDLETYVLLEAPSKEDKNNKAIFRNEILEKLENISNLEFKEDALKILFRTHQEMYIPIPKAKKFHKDNPNFFIRNGGELFNDQGKLIISEEQRTFELVFEPSGERILAHITQDFGKGIASKDNQSILGKWILEKIFQLKPFEPLTKKRLDEIGLNGIRFYKINGDDSVHIQFIFIDINNPPFDFINKHKE